MTITHFVNSPDWKYGTGSRGLNSYGDGGNDLITITTNLTASGSNTVEKLIDGRFDWSSDGSHGPMFSTTDTDATDKYIQFDFAEAQSLRQMRLTHTKTGAALGRWKWQGSNDNWTTATDISDEFDLAPSPPAAFTQASQTMDLTSYDEFSSFRMLGVSGTMDVGVFGTEMFFIASVGELTWKTSDLIATFAYTNFPVAGPSPGIDSIFVGQYDHDPDFSNYVGAWITSADNTRYIGLHALVDYAFSLQGLRLFTRAEYQSADYGIWQLQYKDDSGNWIDSGDPISFALPSGKSDYRVREVMSGATGDVSTDWRIRYVSSVSGTPISTATYYVAMHLIYDEEGPAPDPVYLEAEFHDASSFIADLPNDRKPTTQLSVIVTGGTA